MVKLKSNSGFAKKITQYLQKPTEFWQPNAARYIQLSEEERAERNQVLRTHLFNHISDNSLFRGTMGNSELESAIKNKTLGYDFYRSGKNTDLDLVSHVRDNASALFLSASSCPYTAKPYASCISSWPCRGFILIFGMPKVTTVPHKLLKINPKVFADYDDHMLAHSHSIENGGTKYHSIRDIVRDNNETTIVLSNLRGNTNWKPTLNHDVIQVVEILGPGKLIGSIMAFSEPIYLGHIENHHFKPRKYSVEIVLHCDDDMEKSQENAISHGLIQPGNRFLTLEDATAIDQSGLLDVRIEDDATTAHTLRLSEVPASIPIGDVGKLVAHMVENMVEQKIEQELQDEIKPHNMTP